MPVGGEDPVAVTGPGYQGPGFDDRHPWHRRELDGVLLGRVFHSPLAGVGVGRDIVAGEDGVGLDLGGQADDLGRWVTPAHHQVRTPLAERPAQVMESLDQKAGSVGEANRRRAMVSSTTNSGTTSSPRR